MYTCEIFYNTKFILMVKSSIEGSFFSHIYFYYPLVFFTETRVFSYLVSCKTISSESIYCSSFFFFCKKKVCVCVFIRSELTKIAYQYSNNEWC